MARQRRNEVDAIDIVRSCLQRIAEREPAVQAWEFLDPALAMEHARRRSGERIGGRLDGVPIGIKDIIDTADMPTSYGSEIFAGHRPTEDATCVSKIRAAGGIVLGKTVTTEFAMSRPGKTRNPHDPARTPGGSSSGSAAAVADFMVPLAVGTQTGGSTLRPASYCGIVGYKPTFGLVSRAGILRLSAALDHVGVLARTVADAALLANVLSGSDPRDPTTRMADRLEPMDERHRDAAPKIAYVRTPWWTEVQRSTRDALDALAHRLAVAGADVDELTLPSSFERLLEASVIVLDVDISRSFKEEYERSRDKISDDVAQFVEAGRRRSAADYAGALDLARACRGEFNDFFGRFAAILTPAVAAEAPSAETTGSSLFCRIWTLLGVPTLSLPCLEGPAGLPVGAQLVGRRGRDAELIAAAAWVESNHTARQALDRVEPRLP